MTGWRRRRGDGEVVSDGWLTRGNRFCGGVGEWFAACEMEVEVVAGSWPGNIVGDEGGAGKVREEGRGFLGLGSIDSENIKGESVDVWVFLVDLHSKDESGKGFKREVN
ncbi:hypothetical protein Tco_0597050 [Tanacetum coccineum]